MNNPWIWILLAFSTGFIGMILIFLGKKIRLFFTPIRQSLIKERIANAKRVQRPDYTNYVAYIDVDGLNDKEIKFLLNTLSEINEGY